MRHKLQPKPATGQRTLTMFVALLMSGCQHEARTVLVEAETTSSAEAVPTVGEGMEPSATTEDEVVIVETPQAFSPPTESPSPVSENPETGTPLAKTEIETEAGVEASADSLAPVSRTLPPGTRIELELKTPLHTATTLVGDRFAARVARDVLLGDAVLIPTRSLVEGRVEQVVAAENAEEGGATIELGFRMLLLPSGERVPLYADLVGEDDPADGPRPTQGPDRVAGAARGAVTGAVLGTIFGSGARSTVIGAVLGGAAGAVIVAPAPDREVIVPSGTKLVIVLTEPLDLPAPEATEAS